MGVGKPNSDQHWYQALSVIFKVEKAFQVQTPGDVTDLSNVGKLIGYIAGQRDLSPDAKVSVSLEPPFEIVCQEAFQRLRAGLKAIGGTVPENIDLKISPDQLVPSQNRHENWSKLADELECELPGFDNPKWAMWFSLGITYPFVCVLVVLVLVPILTFLGIAEEAPWYVRVILGPMIFFGTLFLGVVAGAKAESLLFRNPSRVHFDSIREFTSHIALNARGMKESLERSITTTINKYVREVVAKEFGLRPSQIGNDFQLIPEPRSK